MTLEEVLPLGGDLPDTKEQAETTRMQIARGLLGKHRYLRAAKSFRGLVRLQTGRRSFYRKEGSKIKFTEAEAWLSE